MLQSPHTPHEWQRYYDVRWRLLRAPWRQPRGSEKDDREQQSFHLMWCVRPGVPIGVGRIHQVDTERAHVRYMAVLECWQGTGIGRELMRGLEAEAERLGVREIVLNARTNIARFYAALGYEETGPGPLLFGEIPHIAMRKTLAG